MKPLLGILLIVSAAAQTGLTPPRLGFIVDRSASLRPLLGIGGNLLLGDSAQAGVLSAASTDSHTMIKTASVLTVLGPANISMAVGGGPALFAFTAAGGPSLVYLKASRTLLRWHGSGFVPEPTPDLQGEVVAVGPKFVVRRADGLWLVDRSGQTALPGVSEPVLQQPDGGLVYTDQTALVLRSPSGVERRIETGLSAAELRLLGSAWIEAIERDTGRQFAIRITPGQENVYQIPEGQ